MNTAMHRASRLIVRGTVALTLSLLSVLAISATSASAHTELVSSTPADGAVLQAAPTTVTFIFEGPLIPDLDTVSINDAQGTNVAHQKVTPSGKELSIAWPAGLPAGEYEVAYRVVSEDGHPVSNSIRFSYGDPGSAVTAVTPSAAPAAAQDPTAGSSVGPWVFIAAAVLLAASIAVIYVLVTRRR